MHFVTKNGSVWEPENQLLKPLYEVLKKNESTLGGSRVFEDLVDVMESLDADLKPEEEAICQKN